VIFCNLKKITIYIQYIKILILVVGGICHLFWGGEGEDLFFFFSFFFHLKNFSFGLLYLFRIRINSLPISPINIYRGKPGERGGL